MIPKRLEEIAEADLAALITAAVKEGRTIDYKLALPGGADGDRKEFLADVSSFANTSGGDLVFGVEEDSGAPITLRGVTLVDTDAEIQKLDSVIRSGIEPRVSAHIKPTIGQFHHHRFRSGIFIQVHERHDTPALYVKAQPVIGYVGLGKGHISLVTQPLPSLLTT